MWLSRGSDEFEGLGIVRRLGSRPKSVGSSPCDRMLLANHHKEQLAPYD